MTKRSANSRVRPPLPLLVLAGTSAAVAVIPLGYLFVRGFEGGIDALVDSIFRGRVLHLTTNTIVLTILVTVTCLVIGTVVGVILARFKLPGGRLWLLLAALPLAVPSYIAAYGWLVLVPNFGGLFASWFVMSAVCIPYVSLPVAAVLQNSATDLEAVARTLGSSPIGAFKAATWPLIRPAASAGALLAALYTLSDFGAVSMLRFQTLTWGIKSAYSSIFDRNLAALLAMILVVLALVVVLFERRMREPVGPMSSKRIARRIPNNRDAFLAMSVLSVAPVFGVLIPIIGLAHQLFQAETVRRMEITQLAITLGTTVLLAASGALVAVVLAIPIATLAAKYRGKIVSTIESAGYLGNSLPGIVVGLALVFFALSAVPSLYQTFALLVFAYAVLYMSKSIGAIRSGLESVPESLVDLARTQGMTPFQTWYRVSFRIAAPSIGVGALLVAIAIIKEIPATLLLRPTGVSTLAVELWNRTSVLEYGSAAPYAALLLLVAAVPAFFLSGVRGTFREVE